jgi:hypothetical protein
MACYRLTAAESIVYTNVLHPKTTQHFQTISKQGTRDATSLNENVTRHLHRDRPAPTQAVIHTE